MSEVGHGELRRDPPRWSSPAFLDEATAWIDDVLANGGRAREGPVERERVRPWGAVLRAPTAAGTVWLKAPAPATGFEVPLYALLAERAGDRVLEPLAVDEARGWVLLPDGGEPLAIRLEAAEALDALTAALPRYAELQIALLPRADELLAAGLADMRPRVMPQRFDEALANARALVAAGASGGGTELDSIAAKRPDYVAMCERLEGAPGGASIDHNDLHGYNVLAGPGGDWARARFYDWGDAVLSHPFASMLALGFVSGATRGDVERLRDAYLEPWDGHGSRAELVETLELACRVGKVARALTWGRAMSTVRPGDEVAEHFRTAPVAALLTVLDEDWLGKA